jgi:hypothetical protein
MQADITESDVSHEKMEHQVNTWYSIFSCDTSPVYTTQVLIHIDQKLRLVYSVSSVYLC